MTKKKDFSIELKNASEKLSCGNNDHNHSLSLSLSSLFANLFKKSNNMFYAMIELSKSEHENILRLDRTYSYSELYSLAVQFN